MFQKFLFSDSLTDALPLLTLAYGLSVLFSLATDSLAVLCLPRSLLPGYELSAHSPVVPQASSLFFAFGLLLVSRGSPVFFQRSDNTFSFSG